MIEAVMPPEEVVNLASKRQIVYFDRTVRKRFTNTPGSEAVKVVNVKGSGVDYFYHADPEVADNSYFAAQRIGERHAIEFGREGDRLLRRVMVDNPSNEVMRDVSERPLTVDEAQVLLEVMRHPKAFTAENPPALMTLTPQEMELVAQGQE